MPTVNVPPEQPRTASEERAISKVLIVSFLASVGALLLFAWFANEVFEGDAHAFDNAIRTAVNARATPALTTAMTWITYLGNPLNLVMFLLIAVAAFWRTGWKRGAAWLAVTMAGAVVLDITLKLAFHRPRPVAFFGVAPQSYSFPSGHALGSFCFYGTLAALIAHRTRSGPLRVLLGTAAAILIALIGLSRIYLGVHYPTDVIAGYMAAAIWVSSLVALDGFQRRRRWRLKRDGAASKSR